MVILIVSLSLVALIIVLVLLARYHKGFKKLIGKYFYNWLYGLPWGLTDTNNYGYAPTDPIIDEVAGEETFQVQIYWEMAGMIEREEWKQLKALEVGCGRGGGLRHLARLLTPEEVTGLDFSKNAIRFCKKRNEEEGLSVRFVQGDAHALPFEAESFDVVMNVESSHIYQDQAKFLREVARVLKPGGHFLLADYRSRQGDLKQLYIDIRAAGLEVIAERDITENVLQACFADTERREALIAKAPGFIRGYLREFAMVENSNEIKIFVKEYKYLILKVAKKKP